MIGDRDDSERARRNGVAGATSVREAVVQAASALGAELERRAERAPIDQEIGQLLAVDELDRSFRQAASGAVGTGRGGQGLVTASVPALDGSLELTIHPDLLERTEPARLSAALSEALTSAVGAYQRSALERARDAEPDGLLGKLCAVALAGMEDQPSAGAASSAWADGSAVALQEGSEWGVREPSVPMSGLRRDVGEGQGAGSTAVPGASALGGAVPW